MHVCVCPCIWAPRFVRDCWSCWKLNPLHSKKSGTLHEMSSRNQETTVITITMFHTNLRSLVWKAMACSHHSLSICLPQHLRKHLHPTHNAHLPEQEADYQRQKAGSTTAYKKLICPKSIYLNVCIFPHTCAFVCYSACMLIYLNSISISREQHASLA